mmetsp:Transcript_21194/g.45981  ORF Transcript_21194/g.45981 Transcript_21194/m.45981 type:complete len:235 (-) Transcript_21194:1915-2619(-)
MLGRRHRRRLNIHNLFSNLLNNRLCRFGSLMLVSQTLLIDGKCFPIFLVSTDQITTLVMNISNTLVRSRHLGMHSTHIPTFNMQNLCKYLNGIIKVFFLGVDESNTLHGGYDVGMFCSIGGPVETKCLLVVIHGPIEILFNVMETSNANQRRGDGWVVPSKRRLINLGRILVTAHGLVQIPPSLMYATNVMQDLSHLRMIRRAKCPCGQVICLVIVRHGLFQLAHLGEYATNPR